MKTSRPFHRWLRPAVIGAAALGLMPLFADAQTTPSPPPRPKPPPRLAPNPADATRIPPGVDTGTPATSDAMPLGTPVPPSGRPGKDMNSAAARAAARRPASSPAASASRPAGGDAAAVEAVRPASAPAKPRPARTPTPSPPAR